jgi:hypothetical protein
MGKSESAGFNKIIFFWFIKLPGVVTLQLTIAGNLIISSCWHKLGSSISHLKFLPP